MRHLFTIAGPCALALLLLSAMGKPIRVKLKEARMTMELPNDKWALHERVVQPNGVVGYLHKREALRDADGYTVVPFISAVIEDVPPDMDVVRYSAAKRMRVPFEVDRIFIHESGELQYTNAIGYQGHYTDKGREHTLIIVHAIKGNSGIQLICDVTSDLFAQVEPEFMHTVRSLR